MKKALPHDHIKFHPNVTYYWNKVQQENKCQSLIHKLRIQNGRFSRALKKAHALSMLNDHQAPL